MKYFKLTIPLLFLLTSCEKFLEVQPELQVDESIAIINTSTAETAVTGLYSRLASDGYYGSNYPSLAYLPGGDVKWSGSASGLAQFNSHDITADNSTVRSAWVAIYRTILSANQIIEKVPLVGDSLFAKSKRDQLIGEAHFIRALSYFDLVRAWGGVQLVLTPTKTAADQKGISRSSEGETYAQVLKDLVTAEGLLPEGTNRFRATKKTAYALRSRYHLYRQEWDSAEVYASRLIKDGAYRLAKPYGSFFLNNAKGTEESVFELTYSASFTNNHSNQWLPPAKSGRREWAPSDELVALLNDPLKGGNRNVLIDKTPTGLYFGNLYYRSPKGTDPSYVIRIAELYLIRAEARAQQGKLAEALQDLNAIRDRAGITPLYTTDQEAILRAIEQERRLEFPFESDRWFDLVRTGRAAAVLGITDTNKFLFPIPSDEIAADGALTQNPGY